MRIIDLSQPLYDDAPNCPAHPPVKIKVTSSHALNGPDAWHMEHLDIASHTGSHVDAPLHKIQGGRPIDGFPLDVFTGKARIVDLRVLPPKAQITREMLLPHLPADLTGEYVLLATGLGDKRDKTQEWLHEPAQLGPSGAQLLVERNAKGVGIDHYAIGDAETHTILLSKPVFSVEELHFPPEVFGVKTPMEFWALPINLRAHGGAPCRPVMILR
jgi:kynurenine formamidase